MTAAKAIQRLLGCGVGAELFSVDENSESTVALLNDLRHANASGVLPVFHGRLSAVLSMLCGSNIVARGAAPALCKSALPGYTSPIAPHARYGFGSPEYTADGRHRAVFFRLSHGKPLWAGCAGAASAAPVPCFRSSNPAQFRSPRLEAGGADFSIKHGVIAMAHKARIPSCASAPDANPEFVDAYHLNGIDNKIDSLYQYFRYISKQSFRNTIKRELCAGCGVKRLVDLHESQVEGVLQWLDMFREDAIRNWVATQSLEQRFLRGWMEHSRAADEVAVKAKEAA